MSLEAARLLVDSGDGPRTVSLSSYLDASAAETAETEANAWIKSLRKVRIDGVELRDRFTYRGDSLWWFAELYLHKQRVITSILTAMAALEALVERERPKSLALLRGDRVLRTLVRDVAARHGLAVRVTRGWQVDRWRSRLAVATRSCFYAAGAAAAGIRPAGRRSPKAATADIVAFVHSAFWRADAGEEAYVGPVLRAVEGRVPPGRLRLIGLGPRTNFRARGWRQRFAEFRDPQARSLPFAPIQVFSSWKAIRPSLALWQQRSRIRRALLASVDLRRAAMVRGYDIWPLVRDELTGISHLQFPWSARSMDEAGAALDALRPKAVVTYAEAGGWGRALVLEARRRHIPVAGLQHGFIYRHWLNYLHEPDEMQRSPANASDLGFPRPDLTLVHDRFAVSHLIGAGRFPADSVLVVGSPRLEAFAATARRLSPSDRQQIREAVGARPDQQLVVVAAKFTQIRTAFGALVQAVSAMPDVHLVVKCHPAETAAPYEEAAGSQSNVRVVAAATDLAALVASARLLVTVNSTAAIEAMELDVPALVLAMPNNLSPFVEAGAMAGVSSAAEIGPALRALLYDENERDRLAQGREIFRKRYAIAPDGHAAARAAEAIVGLTCRSVDASG